MAGRTKKGERRWITKGSGTYAIPARRTTAKNMDANTIYHPPGQYATARATQTMPFAMRRALQRGTR